MILSLEEMLGQRFCVGFHGLEPPDYLLEWLAQGRVGGVILFARNVASPQQLAELTGAFHAAARHGCLVSIDQEGGTVARLRDGFTESPGAMALAVGGSETQAEQAARILGAEMRALGINWDYAPVLDITYNRHNPSVGTRSFGRDAATVSRFASATVRGLQAAGVAACAKHFPGLGDTAVDTHLELPRLDAALETLMARDLLPYRAVIGEDIASIMTTHTIFTALDPDHPATLSGKVVNGLLRGTLGYQGVVTTDCMEMKAISDHYGPGESAVLALEASIDLVLISHTRASQEAALEAAQAAARSRRLSPQNIEAGAARVARMKARFAASPADVRAVRIPENLDVMRQAAQAAVAVVHGAHLLPLKAAPERIALIEFASILESGIMESGGLTGLARLWQLRQPESPSLSLLSAELTHDKLKAARALAREADITVLATRNAHLIPEQLAAAQDILAAAGRAVLVCLRNPYDAGVLDGAQAALCTFGDSAPSLEAAVAALCGDFAPAAALPFDLT